MQIGFYFDQTRCIGCDACIVACKDWNDIPAGPEFWMKILYNEEGKTPNVFVSYLVRPCYHCEDPVCIPVCPVEAITKRKDDGTISKTAYFKRFKQKTCIPDRTPAGWQNLAGPGYCRIIFKKRVFEL